MPDVPSGPRFDATVSFGTVITFGAMIVAGVIAWTAVRERAIENTSDIISLNDQVNDLDLSVNNMNARVITLENTLTFGTQKVADIDANVKELQAAINSFLQKYESDRSRMRIYDNTTITDTTPSGRR